jgi:hypothetical protein
MRAMMYLAGKTAGLREVHIRMLKRAAQHPEGLFTPPRNSDASTHNRLARELLALGYAEIANGVSYRDEDVWWLDKGFHLLRVTDAGLSAITEDAFESSAVTPSISSDAPAPGAQTDIPSEAVTMSVPVATQSQKTSKDDHVIRKGRKSKTVKSDVRGEATARILELLRRPDGASLDEIMVDLGWQRHTVRGFLSQLRKRGMAIASETDVSSSRRKPPRRYRLLS